MPVILNAHDSYMFGENAFDLVVDVSEAFELMVEMSWCHQSQVTEWLPWVGRHDMDYPKSIDEWRHLSDGMPSATRSLDWRPADGGVFRRHCLGEIPTPERLKADFPNLITPPEVESRLAKRLARWQL